MSTTVGSLGVSPAAASPASPAADTGSHWAPHGTVLTAFVVSINLLVILLIVFFFWRFFSGKPQGQGASAGAEDDEDDDDALPVASPWATRRHRRRDPPRKEVDVAASLPVHVYSAAADGGKAAECAVCIVELRDGDAARLLPRCGHQFHADCVGEWLRLHATCPLCRASVVAPVAAVAAAEAVNPKDAVVGADSPV